MLKTDYISENIFPVKRKKEIFNSQWSILLQSPEKDMLELAILISSQNI